MRTILTILVMAGLFGAYSYLSRTTPRGPELIVVHNVRPTLAEIIDVLLYEIRETAAAKEGR